MQCKKVQSSIDKFHWSNKLRKNNNLSFNLNIRVTLESVNLFLHVILYLKAILTMEHDKVTHNFHRKIRNIFELTTWPVKLGITCPSVIFSTYNRLTANMFEIFIFWLAHVFDKRTPFKIIAVYSVKQPLNWLLREKWESKILLGVEDNVKLDLWSRQLMPSQSTEHKKSYHSPTRLVCVRRCALVDSFLNRANLPLVKLALIYRISCSYYSRFLTFSSCYSIS